MKDQILTPVQGKSVSDKLGRGLCKRRAWMPGINIYGDSYDIGYEAVTEEHCLGVPIRHHGELIGHATTDPGGKATVTLFEGKKLPQLNSGPTDVFVVGLAPNCEKIALASLEESFRDYLNGE